MINTTPHIYGGNNDLLTYHIDKKEYQSIEGATLGVIRDTIINHVDQGSIIQEFFFRITFITPVENSFPSIKLVIDCLSDDDYLNSSTNARITTQSDIWIGRGNLTSTKNHQTALIYSRYLIDLLRYFSTCTGFVLGEFNSPMDGIGNHSFYY